MMVFYLTTVICPFLQVLELVCVVCVVFGEILRKDKRDTFTI